MQIPVNSIQLCADAVLVLSDNDAARAAAQIVLAWLEGPNMKPDKSEPEKVTPRAGQVWQKLNTGTKTATSAPRAKVDWASENMVGLHAPELAGRHGFDRYGWKTMRITTLQRDWHCLNPEG